MSSSALRPLCLFIFMFAPSALSLGAGCIAGGEGAGEESSASEGEALGALIGYTGYLNAHDFNHDSAPDLVAINVISSNLAVRLNKGDGTFHDVVRYSVGLTPTFIASDDFDHNHDLDVAVVNAASNDVSILLGNGDGTFQPADSCSVADPGSGALADAPFGVTTGDFNHDGDVDIVTSNLVSDNISTLLGNGDGTFQAANTYPLISSSSLGLTPFPVATARLDGDDNLDLVSGGADGIVVMHGHGDGSFTAAWQYHTGIAISCIEIADFNRDGKVDIATTAIGSSNYSILLGNGDGTFTFKESKSSGGVAGECFGVGDLNGDHELDLAITNTTTILGIGNVAVLLGNGDGTFSAPVRYPVGLTPWAAFIADFDGNDEMDVAVANGTNTTVSILFGNGDGTLQPQVMYPM